MLHGMKNVQSSSSNEIPIKCLADARPIVTGAVPPMASDFELHSS